MGTFPLTVQGKKAMKSLMPLPSTRDLSNSSVREALVDTSSSHAFSTDIYDGYIALRLGPSEDVLMVKDSSKDQPLEVCFVVNALHDQVIPIIGVAVRHEVQ